MKTPAYPPDPAWLPGFIPTGKRQEGPWWDLKWKIPSGIEKIITAFANDFDDYGGGYIVIGLEGTYAQPDGLLEAEIDHEELKCFNLAAQCGPAINGLKAERFEVSAGSGRFLSAVWVPQSSFRPHASLNDKFYIRVGTTTRAAQAHELKKLFAAPTHWQSENHVALSQWKAQKKYTARAVPNDHKEIGKKAYDVNIGDLGPTYVSLYIMQMSRTISVPLEDLILTEDAGWNRPLLIFKSDRWNLFGEHWQSWGG